MSIPSFMPRSDVLVKERTREGKSTPSSGFSRVAHGAVNQKERKGATLWRNERAADRRSRIKKFEARFSPFVCEI